MTRSYFFTLTSAWSAIALCGSTILALLIGYQGAARSQFTQQHKISPVNVVGKRNILLDVASPNLQQYRLSTQKFDSINLLDGRERWYGGFGVGISSPNLSSNGQIRGINVPFQLDVDTNKQTSFNAFVGRRFANFRIEGEILSTNNSLKNGTLTFRAAPALNTIGTRLSF